MWFLWVQDNKRCFDNLNRIHLSYELINSQSIHVFDIWITLKCVFPYYLKMLYDTSLLLFSLQIKYCMANNKSSKLVNIVLTTYISGRMKLRVTRTVDDEEGFWGWNKTANGRTWHSIQEWMIITYSQLHHQ